jgi:hypothetical protein
VIDEHTTTTAKHIIAASNTQPSVLCTQALSAAAGFAAAALQEALRKQRAEAAQRCDKLEQALVSTTTLQILLYTDRVVSDGALLVYRR